ncbi:hypothetical protein Prudu_016747, partial [Prunus dulcis]
SEFSPGTADSELKGGAERELQLDDGDAGGDIDTRGAGDAGRDGHDGDAGDAGGAGGDIDTGRAGDAGDTGDDGDVDPDKKVDVFRVVEAELQYFVNEIDLIHFNSGQELKDGIEALLLQESARSFKVDDFDGGIGHFLGPVRVFDHNDIPSLEETVTRMIRPHYPESEFQVKYYSYEDLDGDSNNNDPRNIVQLDVSTLGWEEVVMELDVQNSMKDSYAWLDVAGCAWCYSNVCSILLLWFVALFCCS